MANSCDGKVNGDVMNQISRLGSGLEAVDAVVTRLTEITSPIRKPGPETGETKSPAPVEHMVPLASNIEKHLDTLEQLRLRLVAIADEISL